MNWYAAHVVMSRPEASFGAVKVTEIVILLEAADPEDAYEDAETFGILAEKEAPEGSAAHGLRFRGVRKVVELLNRKDEPGHLTEVTFSDFTVPAGSLDIFAAGGSVNLVCADEAGSADEDGPRLYEPEAE